MTEVTAEIDAIIARARKAQQAYESTGNQERFDNAAKAAAWALMEPKRNSELAALAVAGALAGDASASAAALRLTTVFTMVIPCSC